LQLAAVAERTRTSFRGVTELFSRLAINSRELGVNQQQLINFTESLNQAIVISGAGTREANAALIQLSQGIASGTLRGDELRSVLEQLPVVADVIANSLGRTRGELRELGREGAITGEVIFNAFAEAREELADRFARTVPTIGQALTLLRNRLVETADRSQQFGRGLVQVTLFASNTIGAINELANSIPIVDRLTGALGRFNQQLSAALEERREARQPLSTQFSEALQRVTALQGNLERLQVQIDGLFTAQAQGVDLGFDIAERIGEVQRSRATVQRFLREAEQALERLTQRSREQVAAQEQLNLAFANSQLSEQRRLLELNSNAREVEVSLLRLENQARRELGATFTGFTQDQRALIRERLQENQAIQLQTEILEQINGPAEVFNRQQEQLLALLMTGQITFEQYNAQLMIFRDAIMSVEPSSVFADLVTDLQRQRDLLMQTNEERRVQNALLQAESALRAAGVSDEELNSQLEFLGILTRRNVLLEEANRFGLNSVNTTRLQAIAQMEFNLAMSEGASAAEAFQRALAKVNSEGEGLKMVEENANLVQDALVGVAVIGINQATDALVEFIKTGEIDFELFVRNFLADSLALIARLLLIKALQEAIGVEAGSGIGNAIASGTQNVLSTNNVPGRQAGGPVTAGEPFLVGEGGRELFIPSQSGRIIPNAATENMIANVGRGSSVSAAAPVVNVAPPNIIVVNDRSEIPSEMQSSEGGDAIMAVISTRNREVRQSLGIG